MTRIILRLDQDDGVLALRAARWLMRQPPEQKDAILQYDGTSAFYVRRSKTGVSVSEIVNGRTI